MDVNKKISDLIEVIQPLSEDNSLPKNIRRSLNEAIKHLKSDDEPLAKLGAAVYVIEELTEDINLPTPSTMSPAKQTYLIFPAMPSPFFSQSITS